MEYHLPLTHSEAVKQLKEFISNLFFNNPGIADTVRVQLGAGSREINSFTIKIKDPFKERNDAHT